MRELSSKIPVTEASKEAVACLIILILGFKVFKVKNLIHTSSL